MFCHFIKRNNWVVFSTNSQGGLTPLNQFCSPSRSQFYFNSHLSPSSHIISCSCENPSLLGGIEEWERIRLGCGERGSDWFRIWEIWFWSWFLIMGWYDFWSLVDMIFDHRLIWFWSLVGMILIIGWYDFDHWLIWFWSFVDDDFDHSLSSSWWLWQCYYDSLLLESGAGFSFTSDVQNRHCHHHFIIDAIAIIITTRIYYRHHH